MMRITDCSACVPLASAFVSMAAHAGVDVPAGAHFDLGGGTLSLAAQFVAPALACSAGSAVADAVKVAPPPGGGFSVTGSAGGVVRLRVDENGQGVIPALPAALQQQSFVCFGASSGLPGSRPDVPGGTTGTTGPAGPIAPAGATGATGAPGSGGGFSYPFRVTSTNTSGNGTFHLTGGGAGAGEDGGLITLPVACSAVSLHVGFSAAPGGTCTFSVWRYGNPPTLPGTPVAGTNCVTNPTTRSGAGASMSGVLSCP